MLRDYLSPRNPNKKIISRLASGKSIIQVLDRPDGANVLLRYCVALTNSDGVAMTDAGLILSFEELREFAAAIQDGIATGAIRPSVPRSEWEASRPKPTKKERLYIW